LGKKIGGTTAAGTMWMMLAVSMPSTGESAAEPGGVDGRGGPRVAEENNLLFDACGRVSLFFSVDPEADALGVGDALREIPRARFFNARLLGGDPHDTQQFVHVGVDVQPLHASEEAARVALARAYDLRAPDGSRPVPGVRGHAFVLEVAMRRHLRDTGYGRSGHVTVFHASYLGVADQPEFLVASMSRIVDEFMHKYVRANECLTDNAAKAVADGFSPLEPKCARLDSECWFEVSGMPGCHVWKPGLGEGPATLSVFTTAGAVDCAHGKLSAETATLVSAEGHRMEGQLVAGKAQGHWSFDGADGGAQAGSFLDGRAHGLWTVLLADGTKMDGEYVHGAMSGVWTRRQPRGSYERGTLVDGIRQGFWLLRQGDGTEMRGTYVDGERDGPWRVTKPDGTVLTGQVVAGARQGPWTIKAEQGVSVGHFSDGEMQGPWITDHPDGGRSVGTYVRGALSGRWHFEGTDGTRIEGWYANDRMHGLWSERKPDGVVTQQTYVNGVLQ